MNDDKTELSGLGGHDVSFPLVQVAVRKSVGVCNEIWSRGDAMPTPRYTYGIFPIDEDGGSLDALIDGDETTSLADDVVRAIQECPDVETIEIVVRVQRP